ncbi:unnamed protein product [Acanthocheilonema viteae]|uniref:SH2 domain-containing protein n=1 Tax=Acanthocheilonema viteae TaxID=6277 RepID=A0A498SZJ4_ACAVI|nr:unnamed protein product [Acanthocheilonema viteae]
MSESQTSSASASTILSVSSDLPLDDAVSVQTTETTNSLQKTKINYENFCLKNDAITNIASDLIRQDEKVKFPAEVQEQQSNGYLEVEKLVQNMNEDDVQHIAIAYPMNSAKGDENENEEKQKVIMVGGESDKRKAEVVESEMRDDDDDDDDNKMWMTPVNSSVIGNVKIKVENDEAVCEESLKIVEEEKKATNLTNIRDERQHSFYDSSREATNSEMIKNAENVDLMKSASLESYANRAISKSPEHRCIRTTSESPPSATDSWKNATINTNNFIDIGTRSGDTQAANNTTTLQNHQTKIIYNNKTLTVNMLRDKPPGTFVVRDSNSFPGAFGLALKVSTPPPGVHPGNLFSIFFLFNKLI